MDFNTCKTRAALNCGNMQSSDPFYTYLGDYVNAALNAMVLRSLTKARVNLNLFPELRTDWTEITIVDQNYLALPSNLLVVDSVLSFDSSTAPTMATSAQTPMTYLSWRDFQNLPKETTVTGYPRIWTRYNNRLYIWPTPRTGYTSYIHLLGLKKEPELSGATDSPAIPELWHDAWLYMACYKICVDKGWGEDATRFLVACDTEITQSIDLVGLDNAQKHGRIRIEGDPTEAALG